MVKLAGVLPLCRKTDLAGSGRGGAEVIRSNHMWWGKISLANQDARANCPCLHVYVVRAGDRIFPRIYEGTLWLVINEQSDRRRTSAHGAAAHGSKEDPLNPYKFRVTIPKGT